jgi:hypothetical protein
MKRAWLAAVLAAGAGLALAGGSQANTSRHQLKCAPGYVRRSVRVPVRKHGRIVRRNRRIVYTRVQRCVKVRKTKRPAPTAPHPTPGVPTKPVVTAGNTSSTSTSSAISTTSTTSTSTTSTPPPPPPSNGSCPGPPPGASQTLATHTYALEGMDTFTKAAPTGAFAQSGGVNVDANSLTPIYTGDHGMGWSAYPDGWAATYTKPLEGYQPSTVLSVHDGVLDYYLHDDATNGLPVGADISPWPGGSEYQTYGAYSLCERVVPSTDLADFYEASLLWPQNNGDGPCAESDFPESYSPLNGGSLASGGVYAFAHFAPWSAQSGCQTTPPPPAPDSWNTSIDLSQWHMFTQEWGPGFRSYYMDGKFVKTSISSQVWSQPERWQLQMEPSPAAKDHKGGGTGHVYIAWVWIGKPDN